jgi:hypothetical protein
MTLARSAEIVNPASARRAAAPIAHPEHPSAPAPHPAALQLGEMTAPSGRQVLARMQRTQGNQAVVRIFTGGAQRRGEHLNRKCACGGGVGECPQCAAQRKVDFNRKAALGGDTSAIPPLVNEVLRSSGQPIDEATRAFMEPRLGQELGPVRFHTDARAAQSAAAVDAQAYTVGRHVVFGAGQYSPGTEEGRTLIAHELAHVAQQGGGDVAAPRSISDASDAAERAADSVAQAVMRAPANTGGAPSRVEFDADGASGLQAKHSGAAGLLQRRIVVDPAGEAGFILGELNTLCPGKVAASGDTITSSCEATTGHGCDCACDAAGDRARTYTVHVQPAAGRSTTQTLWDGTTDAVPDSTLWPNTVGGNDPDIYVESSGSTIEFGFFKADGTASWYPHWRILAHELCGHGRLRETYSGGTGHRPGHDVTIDTENTIAAEHGQPARGHFADRRQGEAFYNGVGDRSKVVFYQNDPPPSTGLHYEAP